MPLLFFIVIELFVHEVSVLLVEAGLHIVLIGLGGGGLPMFLRLNIRKVSHSVLLLYVRFLTQT